MSDIATQNHLDQIHQDVDGIKSILEAMEKNGAKRDAIIDEIYRALYGDKNNRVEGLIEKQIRDENFKSDFEAIKTNVDANTEFRLEIQKAVKNLIWKIVFGGLLSGAGTVGGYHVLKEIFKII